MKVYSMHEWTICQGGVWQVFPEELHCALTKQVPIESMVVWHQLYFWNTTTPKWGKRRKPQKGSVDTVDTLKRRGPELEQCKILGQLQALELIVAKVFRGEAREWWRIMTYLDFWWFWLMNQWCSVVLSQKLPNQKHQRITCRNCSRVMLAKNSL